MPNHVLIIGATRGLGHELAKQYVARGDKVTGTCRSSSPPTDEENKITWIPTIDIGTPEAGPKVVSALQGSSSNSSSSGSKADSKNAPDIIIVSAGYFATESLAQPNFSAQVEMYKTSAIGPSILVSSLHTAGLLKANTTKIMLISSESGSITLRHESEGGGNYGHHASKSALNMVGKLLSLDLKDEGVAVGMLHPGFMRTEMTKGVGFDKFWDEGGAVTPEVAAASMVEFVDGFGMERSGTYWAPRGAGDIGTAEPVLGPKEKLPTPLQLPW